MRTIGISFLFLFLYGVLPAAFAFPAGFGDLIVAVWARDGDPASSATDVGHVRS
jgi:hypothetical protein